MMDAITLATQPFTYTSRGISVNPNPPSVGELTTITILLNNPNPTHVTVERVAVKVARFGMGLRWEELPPLGPFTVAPDPTHVLAIAQEWTPTEGGHRCVRATIDIAGQTAPLLAGCNLHVVEATAEQRTWHVPFRLGNPERERAPLVLAVHVPPSVQATIIAQNHPWHVDDPIWLDPGEEIDATLVLRAHTLLPIDALSTIETYIAGQLVDGIAVHLLRPAYVPVRVRNDAPTNARERVLAGR